MQVFQNFRCLTLLASHICGPPEVVPALGLTGLSQAVECDSPNMHAVGDHARETSRKVRHLNLRIEAQILTNIMLRSP